jgi:hypothetical protein
MKRNPHELIYPNFLETLLEIGHREGIQFTKAHRWFGDRTNYTVITKRIFQSDIFQTLLEDKIKWITSDFAKT